MDDPQLPGMLGPFSRWNLHATYWYRIGWTLEARHRHDGEALNCPYVVRLEGLASHELAQAVEDFVSVGGSRFDWDAETHRCCPHSAA